MKETKLGDVTVIESVDDNLNESDPELAEEPGLDSNCLILIILRPIYD